VTPAQLVLTVKDVSKAFGGIRALDGVHLELREGEILGIIGPNGAGKTALINTITGFYRVDAGVVQFLDQDITAEPLHAISGRGVARTFQNIRLFKRMTVLENVLVADKVFAERPFTGIFRWRRQRSSIKAAMELLELMGLAEKADQRADSLPYGEARRVEIARALMRNPVLLLLDEPAAGMNEAETARLVRDIRAAMPRVRAMILIEHDMSLIRALSTRIIAMDYGRKIAEGSPDEVLSHPGVQRAYLGEAP